MFTGRVGIFGGSFNPIHNGHLLCAERALEQLKLDIVLFMPNYCAPGKKPRHYADAGSRSTMLWKALQTNDRFFSLDTELNSGEACFTVDTLEKISDSFLKSPFLLMGPDAWANIDTWKEPKRLLGLISGIGVFTQDANTVDTRYAPGKVHHVYVPRIDIRSTDIRNRVAAGKSIRYMVPSGVLDTIKGRGLYRANSVPNKA